MLRQSKTRACEIATLILLGLLSLNAFGQTVYPNRTIRMISGYATGGTTTVVARLVAQKLTEAWGEQVVIDNRPGAGTMIGTDILAKSPPDGYSIMLSGSSHVLAPLLLKAPYDPLKDFAPVATIATTELVLVVHPSVPAMTYQELVAYANYATPAAGGEQHLVTELFNLASGIQTQHVPYKGSSQALMALLGGEIQLFFATPVTAMPHIQAGKVRAIAITGEKRLVTLPTVPTFAESGLSGFYEQKRMPYGILAPAGTPQPIIDKIAHVISTFVAQPDFQAMLIQQGLVPHITTPKQYADLLAEGLASNAAILSTLRKANIRFEN
jgi:tripartite-type tricarboxylate transporter receptor subunit TctC